jgi:lysosomal Pro-X carboxypeptidase
VHCRRYGLLQFLTMEQALADYAVIIDYLKSTTPGANTSAVIAFGGSYGGAWLQRESQHPVMLSAATPPPV